MSSGIDQSSGVVEHDSTLESVVMEDEGHPSADASELPSFGQDLSEGERRTGDPHQTRPLEPSDLWPVPHSGSGRLADEIAAALSRRGGAQQGDSSLLARASGTGSGAKAQIRLKPGTTRRKIAGAGVTAEPFVFQSEKSEGLVEQWIDATLGTDTHANNRGDHHQRPMPPAAALPPLPISSDLDREPPTDSVETPNTVLSAPFPQLKRRLPAGRALALVILVVLAFIALLALAVHYLLGTGLPFLTAK